MAKSKVTKTEIISVASSEGEIIQEIKTDTYGQEREPDYVKIYIEDIGKLNEITGKSNEVLIEFIRHMNYKNIIPAYKPIKQMIATNLGVSLHTVEKAVKLFKKKGLFISVARGIYMADPKLFGRGKWSDIKNLRLVVDYKKDGTKQLKSNLSEQLKLNLGM